jgi:Uma2 family endonuclease
VTVVEREHPAPAADAESQLEAVREYIRRLRGPMPGEKANNDSGSGGEAGQDTASPSTPAAEAGMLTTHDPEAPPKPFARITPRQYLLRERRAEYRSEYWDGEIRAMAGGSPTHAAIAQNIASHLYFRVSGECRVYQSDLKVQVDHGAGYAYPDVLVLCGRPRFIDRRQDVVTNPALVFEVLSPGTEKHDRGTKANAYRRVESLAAYLLVSQQEPRVELYARAANGEWECSVFQRPEDRIRLDAICCELSLAEIYRNVFPAS